VNRLSFRYLFLLVGAACGPLTVCAAEPVDPLTAWQMSGQAMLEKHCTRCHGGVRQQAGLDLRSLTRALEGGEQGDALVPGAPDDSLIFLYAMHGADPQMPPEPGKELPEEDLRILKAAIAALPPVSRTIPQISENSPDWPQHYVGELEKLRPQLWTPPTDLTAHEVIDGFIDLALKRDHLTPAPLCNDRTFVRRVSLDLIGRIPTRKEVDDFLADSSAKKREQLIDRLLDSPEHARHLSLVLDAWLVDRTTHQAEKQHRQQGWFAWLERCVRENRPWNRMVRDLIVARPESSEERGCVVFLLARKDNHQSMAEAVAPVLFGARMDCAQCHDHPLAWEIEQKHYWALVAAFNRSTAVDARSGRGMAESATGGFMSFANLQKESQPAVLSFVSGQTIDEHRPAPDEKEVDSPELYLVPPAGEKQKPETPAVPKFSRRAELARISTEGNPLLARACVNRMWALFLGRGLVHPADQIDSRHPASHPELLAWLTQDFIAQGYNLRQLTRELFLSQAYQRESRWDGEQVPLPESFARAIERPVSASQYMQSLLVATGNAISKDGKLAGQSFDDLQWECGSRFPNVFSPEYNASVGQALYLSNSPHLNALLKPDGKNTAAQLMALKTPQERISMAYQSVLGREPDAVEQARLMDYLEHREPATGVQQLLWILVTSAEFMVNH